MKKKIMSILLGAIIIATVFNSCFSVSANSLEKQAPIGDDIDRWGVIVGVGDYLDDDITDLNCDEYAMSLYDLLLGKDNRWDIENTQLLINKNATRKDILDALDWLIEKAGEGDIIIFFFLGHGTFIKDENGDERDRFDEAICPYDYYYNDKEEPINVITDDELSDKFDSINEKNIEGMFLIFSSCLSGGLIDGKNTRNREFLPFFNIINILNSLKKENKFTSEFTQDISSNNRVILVGSTPHGITWNIFGEGIIESIENGETTAEDISKYSKQWYIEETFWDSIEDLRFSFRMFILFMIKYGYPLMWAPYIPLIKDGYPADNPSSAKLPIIGDSS